jgi:hypothetical protein
MPGLLNPGQQQQPMQQQPGQQMQQPGQQKSAQERFDKFVTNALKILNDPQVTDGIIKKIQSAQDPVDAIGEAALDIVVRLEQSAESNQYPTTANTIFNGMNVIVGAIVKMAEAAGMGPFNDEQKFQAWAWAVAKYLSIAVQQGKITQEQLQMLEQKLQTDPKGQEVLKQLGGA